MSTPRHCLLSASVCKVASMPRATGTGYWREKHMVGWGRGHDKVTPRHLGREQILLYRAEP